MHETGDAFAGGKWPEIGRFVGAEVSAVSIRGSDPPALVSSVSDEAADGRFVGAGGPIGEIKLAQQGWILGEAETKFAMLAKKGRFWGVLCVLGEFCTAWALMEPSRASFVPPVGRYGATATVGGGWDRPRKVARNSIGLSFNQV